MLSLESSHYPAFERQRFCGGVAEIDVVGGGICFLAGRV